MKALITAGILLAICNACTPAEDYKKVRTEVVEEHDQVMLDSERAIHNRERFDTLLTRLDSLKRLDPSLDTAKARGEMLRMSIELSKADLEMDKWMKEFEAELGNRTNDEAVTYFKNERLKLKSLDSLFQKVLKESGEYLSKY